MRITYILKMRSTIGFLAKKMKAKISNRWQFSKRERHALLFIVACYLCVFGIEQLICERNYQAQILKENICSVLFTYSHLYVEGDSLEKEYKPKFHREFYDKKEFTSWKKDSIPPKQKFTPSAKPFLSGPSRIEINAADSAEWNSLPGIGDYMTKAILNYRAALGGFVNMEQLQNMRQMRPETFEKIKDHLWCDPKKITPLPINTADAYTLSKNPYLSYAHCKTIVAYREKHGPILSFETIEHLGILDDLTITALRPYLAATFEQAAKNEPIP